MNVNLMTNFPVTNLTSLYAYRLRSLASNNDSDDEIAL